jgi:hypothetical protein
VHVSECAWPISSAYCARDRDGARAQARALPKTLHYAAPNPRIDFAKSPFAVLAEARSWPHTERMRRAGGSSFGVGGTKVGMTPFRHKGHSVAPGSSASALLARVDLTGRGRARSRCPKHSRPRPEVKRANIWSKNNLA